MDLHDHPPLSALFERARPAAVIPADGVPIPLGMVVQHAGVPGGIAQFGEPEAQIPDRKIGGFEGIFKPDALTQLLEGLKADDGGLGIGVKDEEFVVIGDDGKEALHILGQCPADGIVDDLFNDQSFAFGTHDDLLNPVLTQQGAHGLVM